MIELHPQILKKDGKKEFVVLPFEEFVRIEEELTDYEDLQILRAAKQEEGAAETLTLTEVREMLP
jgi:PHD/YefM family antitoxin component YafN of YafNO toxin-antitoxin module